MRFKRAKSRCLSGPPKVEFVKLAQDRLDFELRKKFEGMTFFDLFELSERATRYKNILREDNQHQNSLYGTYYQDPNYEVNLVEFAGNRPFTCEALARKDSQAQESNKPQAATKTYSFDLTKADPIFDMLLEAKKIKLVGRHKIPTHEELHAKDYCK